MLKLKWDGRPSTGYANFRINWVSKPENKFTFECVDSGWGFMKEWTIISKGTNKDDQNNLSNSDCTYKYTKFNNYCVDTKGRDTKQVGKPEGNASKNACMQECNKIKDCTGVEWFDSKVHGPCLLTITGWSDRRVASGFPGDRYHDAQCFVKNNKCDGNNYKNIEVEESKQPKP